jgi:cytochrome oxidase assembly protein ShyY1
MVAHLNRQFQFSWYISGPALLLIVMMCRLSYWQWTRHLEKLTLIKEFEVRLNQNPIPLQTLLKSNSSDWEPLLHRRVWLEGHFDFTHEMILKNRRHDNQPGTFVVTPLKLEGTDTAILVNRGFIPLQVSGQEERKQFQRQPSERFIGLIKESSSHRFLAPADPPTGTNFPWVDAWLRINIPEMSKQLPYQVLPIYAEAMPSSDLEKVKSEIFKSKNDKTEILNLATRSASRLSDAELADTDFPVVQNDLIIPPGRHFGYVFEWLFLALLTAFLALIIQLKKRVLPMNGST